MALYFDIFSKTILSKLCSKCSLAIFFKLLTLIFCFLSLSISDCLLYFFAVLRIRSRFLISLLSSLLNYGLSLLRTVTILVGMHSNKLIDTIDLFNFTNVIEKPTRVTEHSSTLLDPIIISDSIHYSFSDVLKVPSDISDHDASIIFLECPKFQTRSFQREVWLYLRLYCLNFVQNVL
jgi:hypothetical protein